MTLCERREIFRLVSRMEIIQDTIKTVAKPTLRPGGPGEPGSPEAPWGPC